MIRRSPLKRMKSISAKKLKKLGGKMPFSTITAPKKAIRKVNPVAKAKREKRYKSHLSSAYWKALRRERWEMVLRMYGDGTCENCGGPIETLSKAHLAHLTYARFGHELIEDVRINCPYCNTAEAALRGKRIRRSA